MRLARWLCCCLPTVSLRGTATPSSSFLLSRFEGKSAEIAVSDPFISPIHRPVPSPETTSPTEDLRTLSCSLPPRAGEKKTVNASPLRSAPSTLGKPVEPRTSHYPPKSSTRPTLVSQFRKALYNAHANLRVSRHLPLRPPYRASSQGHQKQKLQHKPLHACQPHVLARFTKLVFCLKRDVTDPGPKTPPKNPPCLSIAKLRKTPLSLRHRRSMPNLGTLAHEEGNDAQEPIQRRFERIVQ